MLEIGLRVGSMIFRIKICGITNVDDALAVAAAGADAVGLNFFANSPRFVAPDRAKQIVLALPAGIVRVGLFVNDDAATICRLADELPLDLIQLHGDEPPEFLSQLAPRRIMRVFRVGAAGLQPVRDYLDRCTQLGCRPELVLLDSQVAGSYGGTGVSGDWAALAGYHAEIGWPPLVLAGGLTPENVAAAIRAVRPAAVDTASGVEISPGRKSADRVRAFVAAARDALVS